MTRCHCGATIGRKYSRCRPCGHKARRKADPGQVRRLLSGGLSGSEVARIVGVSRARVSQIRRAS